MGLMSRLDLVSKLNILAICAALTFVGAVVAGVF
jgi:hypothetical protein